MKVSKILDLIDGKLLCGGDKIDVDINQAFASDLMSDVLTMNARDVILLTGLSNIQVIRTAEMSDLQIVVFVRGKQVTDDMIELAEDNGMVLISTPYSMFKASGLLYVSGLEPVY